MLENFKCITINKNELRKKRLASYFFFSLTREKKGKRMEAMCNNEVGLGQVEIAICSIN